jgi:hypothetical protein
MKKAPGAIFAPGAFFDPEEAGIADQKSTVADRLKVRGLLSTR